MAGDRVLRQKAGLHTCLFGAQLGHEGGVIHQRFQRVVGGVALVHGCAVFGALTHQGLHQLVLGAPAVALRPGGVCHALQLPALPCHRLVGIGLQARVDGGADHQAVRIQAVALAVGPVDELLAQLDRKVWRRAHDLGLAFEVDAQRALLQGLELLGIELAALDHLRQHRVAAGLRALGVEHRVVVGRALEHADQRGAFQHIELVGRLVEIGARGHLDAVGVVQKRHGVEIGLQDLVLGIRRLDLERGDRLLELARQGARAADFLREQVACQLLGDGGAALRVAAQRQHH